MKVEIKAGLLADITNFIKTLSKALMQAIDKIGSLDTGLKIEKGTKTDDGGITFDVTTPKGNKFTATFAPTDKANVLSAYFKSKNGKTYQIKQVKDTQEEYMKAFEQAANKLFGESSIIDVQESDEDVELSTRIKVSLQKVVSAKDTDIRMCAITANCDVCDALASIDNVLADEDFINQLGEEPASFAIVDEGNEFDVQPIENDFDLGDAYISILQKVYQVMFDAQYIHWNYSGDNFNDIHSISNDIYWQCSSIIDFLSELKVENFSHANHPLSIVRELYADSDCGYVEPDVCDCESTINSLISSVSGLADTLDCYYCNFENDVQHTFDGWIRTLKQQAKFQLPGILGRNNSSIGAKLPTVL